MNLFRKSSKITVPAATADALGDTYSEHEMQALTRLGTLVDLPAGSTLTLEGSHGAEALVLISGRARVERGGELLAALSPGDLIGEMALLSGDVRSATVTCSTDASVYVLNPREFRSLLADCPNLELRVRALADAPRRSLTPR